MTGWHRGGSSTEVTYAVVEIGNLTAVLPQHSILAIELLEDVTIEPESGDSIGRIEVEADTYSVFCLDESLQPTLSVPEQRRVCVVLSTSGGDFAVLCDRIRNIDNDDVRPLELPRCMDTVGTPVSALCVMGERIACCVEPDRLSPPALMSPSDLTDALITTGGVFA